MKSSHVNSGARAEILRTSDGINFERLNLPLSAVEVIANGIKCLGISPKSLLLQYEDRYWIAVNMSGVVQ